MPVASDKADVQAIGVAVTPAVRRRANALARNSRNDPKRPSAAMQWNSVALQAPAVARRSGASRIGRWINAAPTASTMSMYHNQS